MILPKLRQSPFKTLTISAPLRCLFTLAVVLNLVVCGGGSSGGLPPVTPPAADFSLAISPTTVSIQQGQSQQVSLSATGLNGFSSPVTVQVNGLPTGVTLSSSSISLTPGNPLQITVSATTLAPPTTTTITFAGTYGALTHAALLSLKISAAPAPNPPSLRMRYTRTDAATPYSALINSNWIFYHAPTSRFFVADPFSNRVIAIDGRSEAMIGSVMVPGAFSVDDTPDHSKLYVGTEMGDVYTIDPVAFTVTARYPASSIGDGFFASNALVMADGQVALLGIPASSGPNWGFPGVSLWNPLNNSLTTLVYAYVEAGVPEVCPGMWIGAMSRTPDRSQVIVADREDGGAICEINEITGAAINSKTGGNFRNFAITPDGTRIVIPKGPGQAVVLDAHTLTQLSSFDIAGDASAAAAFFISADSKTLYTPTFSGTTVFAYDLTSGEQVGWFPFLTANAIFTGSCYGPCNGPHIVATDGSGLFAGPMEQGVGFLDASAMQTGPIGDVFVSEATLNPATGPEAGGTVTAWGQGIGSTGITGVYFGTQLAPSVSMSSGAISATTPVGAPGPVGVYTMTADGGSQLLPEAFSYGPTVLQITPNAATAEGGQGVIYGYGLVPIPPNNVPSNVRIVVGGSTAQITGSGSNVYGVIDPPFPLQAVTYTIPLGTAYSTVDATVTTSAGTTTVHNGMTYLPSIRQFPLSGASLAQGVYDSRQDLYYFTDASNIRVFSKTAGAWLAPITIPPPYSPKRLWGIALSPDGSKLAVADSSGETIYVLNPASPSAVQGFAIPQPQGNTENPIGLAISNAGIVYFWAITEGQSAPVAGFVQLDTNSGQFTPYSNACSEPGEPYCLGTISPSNYLRVAISADNSLVYSNDEGFVFMVDTSTNTATSAMKPGGSGGFDSDLSLSASQTRVAATEYFYDSSLNAQSFLGLNPRELMNVSYLYGEKLSPDGSLLFQPTTLGIDVIDARLGNLRARIALPMALSPNYDALVSDGTDDVLVAITGANGDGVAVIDLTSIPEPAPLPYQPSVQGSNDLAGKRFTNAVHPQQVSGQAAAGKRSPACHHVPHVIKSLLNRK